jgi:hypothetical protein
MPSGFADYRFWWALFVFFGVLVLMTTSIVVMTGLVFAVLLGAPPALVVALRILAVLGVLGVVVLSMRL